MPGISFRFRRKVERGAAFIRCGLGCVSFVLLRCVLVQCIAVAAAFARAGRCGSTIVRVGHARFCSLLVLLRRCLVCSVRHVVGAIAQEFPRANTIRQITFVVRGYLVWSSKHPFRIPHCSVSGLGAILCFGRPPFGRFCVGVLHEVMHFGVP